MSIPTQIYAASCNPPRRAKRPRSQSIPESVPQTAHPESPSLLSSLPKLQPRGHHNGSITPPVPSSHEAAGDVSFPATSEGTPKRGRKTTSRAAREAQRKLNHSMIEKVRRTKINDALAMLRALVPVDYGQQNQSVQGGEDDDDDESTKKLGTAEDDRDDETRTGNKKVKRGKKDEKEKEYKLEILVRTVAFVQDLVEKVRVMEAERGGNTSPSEKKQHPGGSPTSDHPDVGRLPSISSWLPPSTFHSPPSSRYPDRGVYHLPSPPSSTLVDPVKTTQIPPILTLDLPSSLHKSASTITTRPPPLSSLPSSSSSSFSEKHFPISPRRTPEDESAASLLLQISNSPPSLPMTHHTTPSFSPAMELPKSATLGSTTTSSRIQFKSHTSMQAQTPSSLLGLNRAQRQGT